MTECTKLDWVKQIGPNGTEVDLMGLNKNCLIFRENKLSLKILEKKLYIILQYKIIIYFHASRGSATSYIKSKKINNYNTTDDKKHYISCSHKSSK